MQSISQRNANLLLAYNAGYRVGVDGGIVNPNGRPLNGYNRRGGYREFSIKKSGRVLHVSAHRLASFQKYGQSIFQDGIQTRHLNGNPSDNSYSNIAIGTSSENHFDKPKETRSRVATIASHRAHNQERWTAIDADRLSGMSYKAIRAKYGISLGTLSYRYSKK